MAIWPMKRLRIVVLALLCLIVVTVLYLNIHWPVDIIAGVALGVACGLAAIVFVEKWQKKEFKLSKIWSLGK